MILHAGDIHFGLKSHSMQLANGLVTSEQICVDVLEAIYQAAKSDDITCVIFSGDVTHTNHPTALVISYLTEWVRKLDSLDKPIFFIPGNHDKSNYAHSFSYFNKLALQNTIVLDTLSTHMSVLHSIGDTTIYFVPFEFSGDAVNKYLDVQHAVENIINQSRLSKTIIVSHFQESASQSGSERAMISKSVETLDLDNIPGDHSNVLLALGHIHKHQVYTKRNGIKVTYCGNPYPMDKTDCNQQKGFNIIDPSTFEVTFMPIKQSRYFLSYDVGSQTSVLDFFKSVRLVKNSHIFVEKVIVSDSDKDNLRDLIDYLKPFNITLAPIKYVKESLKQIVVTADVAQSMTNTSFKSIFKDIADTSFKDSYSEEDYVDFLSESYEVIDSCFLN